MTYEKFIGWMKFAEDVRRYWVGMEARSTESLDKVNSKDVVGIFSAIGASKTFEDLASTCVVR